MTSYQRTCRQCNKEKGENDFYTKGKRIDTLCKECARNKRKKRYRREKKNFERYKSGRITKVIMTRNKNIDEKQFKRDMKTAKSILTQFLVKLLTEKEGERKNVA